MRTLCGVLVLWGLTLANRIVRSENTADYAVQLSATIQGSSQITLSWTQDSFAIPDSYTVFRKSPDATSWGVGTVLSGSATSYTDNNVSDGSIYEYQVFKNNSTYSYTGYGYIYVGINAPLIENRGKIVLVVDNTYASDLALELNRLQEDLVGDGWGVIRHDVARSDSILTVKGLIKADYDGDPSSVKAALLFGHVAVPYSGDIAPDDHVPQHQGAWSADVFYADMNGSWTDSSVNDSGADSSRNWNVPGDGKYDQSLVPSQVELELGRVDLSDLTAFDLSERELLRQYLNKDHNYRHKLIIAERRGLVHDSFGTAGGAAFAASGWRNFAPFFGPANITVVPDGQWFSTLSTQSYLFAYGCGPGSYTSIAGLGNTGQYNQVTTWDFASTDARAVFYMLYGSWLPDWDSQNDLMRATLCTPTFGLGCIVGGLPHWFGHHMALGETIGFSTRLTQSNGPSGLYQNDVNTGAGMIHVALMGDPTLRLHPVAPVSSLVGAMNSGGVNLNWAAAPDSVLGYHVYRGASVVGPFTRLTSSLVSGTSYTDPAATSGTYTYMVRGVKLETTPSGSYYNVSQGVFVTVSSSASDTVPPTVSIASPQNNATVSGSSVTISTSASDNVGVAGIQIMLDGANLGSELTTAPYNYLWNSTSTPDGSHTFTAVARDAAGNRTTSNPVTVFVSNGTSVNTIWIDDTRPAGSWTGANGSDAWQWVSSNPTPFSGSQAHQSLIAAGLHYHYFAGALSKLSVNSGDRLFAYVFLDPANPPQEVMLQWFDGTSWAHAAYWGANRIAWGVDGTASQRPMGTLPPTGQWGRLEVPASLVGLEGKVLSGMNFILYDGRATWDYSGKAAASNSPPPDSTPPTVNINAPPNNSTVSGASVAISASASDNVGVVGIQFKLDGVNLGPEGTTSPYTITWDSTKAADGFHTLSAVARDAAGNQTSSSPVTVSVNNATSTDVAWVNDALPAGAWPGASGGDAWQWVNSNPSPFAGSLAHQSALVGGVHYHFFAGASAPLGVSSGDRLIAYIFLDPGNPPQEAMLQWFDGVSWAHAAYWGANRIAWGTDGTASQRSMGSLPAAGQWARLEVPANLVDLENHNLYGMNFILYDGRATWDYAGESTTSGSPPADATPPNVTVTRPANNTTVSGSSVTVSADASDNVGVVGVQFKLDNANLGTEISSSPYTMQWNTTATSSGSHTLTAIARDAAGNQTTSLPVTIRVSNGIILGTVWVEDSVPAGAWTGNTDGNEWLWVSDNPTPFSGALSHQTGLATGLHFHYFTDASSALSINQGDQLFAYVFLDPANPPQEVMLQWYDGASWSHAAYWGANLIPWGTDGTASQQSMGALPAVGQWVQLSVPASLVGLEGSSVVGMNFILYDGRASWDYSGKGAQ